MRKRLTQISNSGRGVVPIGDEVLPPELIGPSRVDPDVMLKVLSGLPHRSLLDEHGRVFAYLVEPAETSKR